MTLLSNKHSKIPQLYKCECAFTLTIRQKIQKIQQNGVAFTEILSIIFKWEVRFYFVKLNLQ